MSCYWPNVYTSRPSASAPHHVEILNIHLFLLRLPCSNARMAFFLQGNRILLFARMALPESCHPSRRTLLSGFLFLCVSCLAPVAGPYQACGAAVDICCMFDRCLRAKAEVFSAVNAHHPVIAFVLDCYFLIVHLFSPTDTMPAPCGEL